MVLAGKCGLGRCFGKIARPQLVYLFTCLPIFRSYLFGSGLSGLARIFIPHTLFASSLVQGTTELGKVHIGEAEAIALAREVAADILLRDERCGRRIARQHVLHVMGVVGTVLLAKSKGILPEVRIVLDESKDEAGSWIGETLYHHALKLAGEG